MDFLVTGLGNPGDQYHRTRHNIGFRVVDRLSEQFSGTPWTSQFQSMVSKIRIGSTATLLQKPLTYMNRSGQAVRQVMDFYKSELNQLIVITDDINLETGSVRIRPGGSAGGHNGLTDIIRHVGSQEFVRVRLGVGNNFERGRQADYVLAPFPKSEETLVDDMIQTAMRAVECIITEGIPKAMSLYNKTT